MVMTNSAEVVHLRPVYRGKLADRPRLKKQLMVRYTVALPTEGSSSLSPSAVKLSCFCSKSLAIALLGAVALLPSSSNTASRFVCRITKHHTDIMSQL